MTVSWVHVVTGWQLDAVALLGISLEAGAAAVYCYGVHRLRRSGGRWSAGRTVGFLLGLVALAGVLQSGFASYDDLMWVHMTQHLVIMMLAAPLLALGAPVRLSLAAGSGSVRRFVTGVLHDPSMRLVAGVGAAVLLPLDYYGSMAIYVLTPLFRLSEVNSGFHEFVHLYFLACGLMFWVPMLGIDPASWRPSFRTKLGLVAVGVPVYVAIAAGMLAEGSFMSPAHSATDINRGALTVLLGGTALTLGGALLLGWRQRHRWVAMQRRAAVRRSLVPT